MSRDDEPHRRSKGPTSRQGGSNHTRGTGVREHEHWDLPPAHPPLADERPDGFPADPTDEAAYQAYHERRCGRPHESRPVEWYEGEFEVSERFVDALEGAVGQLQWNSHLDDLYVAHGSAERYAGQRWCSGTLVDDDLLLTAGHCFALQNAARPVEVAQNMHVNFDYQLDPEGELREEHRYDVVELVEHEFRFAGLDYAIVRLEGAPGREFGTVDVAASGVAPGETLCIISHPDGLPKRVEAGHASHVHDVRIGYDDVDTAHGSSGAAVLESPGGRLVGVHTMGGCDGARSGHNHGVRLSALVEASPILADLAAGQPGTEPRSRHRGGHTTWSSRGGGHARRSTDPTRRAAPATRGHADARGAADPWGALRDRSALESHRSILESHRSILDSDGSALHSHRSVVEANRSALEAHRTTLRLHGETLESSVERLEAFERALEACTADLRAVAERAGDLRAVAERAGDPGARAERDPGDADDATGAADAHDATGAADAHDATGAADAHDEPAGERHDH